MCCQGLLAKVGHSAAAKNLAAQNWVIVIQKCVALGTLMTSRKDQDSGDLFQDNSLQVQSVWIGKDFKQKFANISMN